MISFDDLIDIKQNSKIRITKKEDYKIPLLLESYDVIVKTKILEPSQESRIKKHTPWVDKYRPKKLSGIVQQTEVVKVLKSSMSKGNLPHLLFYGPPGTGKTSVIMACARELYGPKIFSERVIELNASDERGINVVRNKIISFANTSIGNEDPKYPSPKFKLVILDEADAMTTEAQSALRKVIEQTSHITRFCFICNYINQIIDPIASRCMKFRFKPINDEYMAMKLEEVAINENIKLSIDVIKELALYAKGDARKAIMTLQNLNYIYKWKGSITVDDVKEMTNSLPKKDTDDLYKLCKSEMEISKILDGIMHIQIKGYPIHAIMEAVKTQVIECKDLNDKEKSLICIKLGLVEKQLIDGSNEFIQLINIVSFINGVYKKKITDVMEYIC